MADLKNFVSDTATSFLNEFFAPLKDDNGVALPSRYEVMFFVPTGTRGSAGNTLNTFAGLINDVVVGLPMGISSLSYLLICGFAVYLRNITLRPNLIKDWLFFLFTISLVNSILYIVLILFFGIDMNFYFLFFNIIFTFMFYYIFSYIFDYYSKFNITR